MVEEIKKLPIQYQKVSNPTTEDLHFKYDSANYVLKAGETEDKWSTHHAKHAAKKLADKNIKTSNPEEHRVLMGAYLGSVSVEVIAKRLGVDIGKIQKEALTKEKAKSRLINLEAQMASMNAESKALREEMKAMKEKKVEPVGPTETLHEPVKAPEEEEILEEDVSVNKEVAPEGEPDKKVDKRTKEYKESQTKK